MVVVRTERNVLRVQAEKGSDVNPMSLFDITFTIMRGDLQADTDVYALWSVDGETLRARYDRLTATRPVRVSAKTVRREQNFTTNS